MTRLQLCFVAALGVFGATACGNDAASPDSDQADADASAEPDAAESVDASGCAATEVACGDTLDDDCDGEVDCDDDDDCAALPACACAPAAPVEARPIPDGQCEVEGEVGQGPIADIPCDVLEVPLAIASFPPAATLSAAADLARVCVAVEHSWARDLQVELTCPGGAGVVLQAYLGWADGEIYLGTPVDGDEFQPAPGLGTTYCWVPSDGSATMIAYAEGHQPPILDLPAGDYAPTAQTWDALVGCPLNGAWSLGVQDRWSIDNGYVFSWWMEFADLAACPA